MISYLNGTLITKNITTTGCKIVLDVNNIGYEILINKKTYKNLPDINSQLCVYTTLLHKEDAMFLCGFLSVKEREMFQILQTVSGIGMKAALLILELQLDDIVSAVLSDNEKLISQVKGIGPKLAKRLILELKDKFKTLKTELAIEVSNDNSKTCNYNDISQAFAEAQAVLHSLGYTDDEINLGLDAAKNHVNDKNATEEILQTALAIISGS